MAQLITVQHGGGWAAIPNRLVEDRHITWKAKGLWAYLHSRPAGWQVREADLVARSKDGRDSVRSALAELEEYGWLTRERGRKQGKFQETTYHLHEPKEPRALQQDLPLTENPATVFPATENPPLSNTEESKKKNNNTHGREVFARHCAHWLALYPERPEPHPKSSIFQKYIALREAGVSEQQLLDALHNYKAWCKKNDRLGTRYIYSPVSFLLSHWSDWVERKPEADYVQSSDGTKYLR